MLSTLALAAVLQVAPAQAGALTLANARVTYGELGPTRPDARYLPGDVMIVSFDIEGLKVSPEGRVNYSMGMTISDSKGAPVFNSDPKASEEMVPLGGTKLPARAFFLIDPNQAPGPYSCKVTVGDPATKATKVLDMKYEVLPKAFGIVGLFATVDKAGQFPTPMTGVAGQSIFLNYAVAGFTRDAMKKSNVVVEMRIADEQRQLTLPKTLTVAEMRDVPEDLLIPGANVLLPLNREGNFAVELKATDKLNGKTSVVVVPVRVLPVR